MSIICKYAILNFYIVILWMNRTLK